MNLTVWDVSKSKNINTNISKKIISFIQKQDAKICGEIASALSLSRSITTSCIAILISLNIIYRDNNGVLKIK